MPPGPLIAPGHRNRVNRPLRSAVRDQVTYSSGVDESRKGTAEHDSSMLSEKVSSERAAMSFSVPAGRGAVRDVMAANSYRHPMACLHVAKFSRN